MLSRAKNGILKKNATNTGYRIDQPVSSISVMYLVIFGKPWARSVTPAPAGEWRLLRSEK